MNDRVFNPLAALLAWLWPGAGHMFLGQKRRGRYIMMGVLLLFLGGILIGGVDTIDHKDDRLWFLAQGLCGPIAFVSDWVNQAYVKHLPLESRYLTTGINTPNEMRTLVSAPAG